MHRHTTCCSTLACTHSLVCTRQAHDAQGYRHIHALLYNEAAMSHMRVSLPLQSHPPGSQDIFAIPNSSDAGTWLTRGRTVLSIRSIGPEGSCVIIARESHRQWQSLDGARSPPNLLRSNPAEPPQILSRYALSLSLSSGTVAGRAARTLEFADYKCSVSCSKLPVLIAK